MTWYLTVTLISIFLMTIGYPVIWLATYACVSLSLGNSLLVKEVRRYSLVCFVVSSDITFVCTFLFFSFILFKKWRCRAKTESFHVMAHSLGTQEPKVQHRSPTVQLIPVAYWSKKLESGTEASCEPRWAATGPGQVKQCLNCWAQCLLHLSL